MADTEFLTTTQVAAMFQVRQKRVRQWIENGQLRAVRTPGGRGTWRIPRLEVEKFLGVTMSDDSREVVDGGPS